MYNFRASECDTVKYYPNGLTQKQVESKRKRWFQVFDIVGSVVLAIILILLCFTFLFRAVNVNGRSMVPTLNDGDWLLVSDKKDYERGDIVIITQPNAVHEPLVKRVIAKGGETIDIDFDTHEVRVDGNLLEEDYIKAPTALSYDVHFPYRVPEGCIFAMGDNRNDSLDSRSTKIGPIDERYILGRAVFRVLPVGSFSKFDSSELYN